MSEPGVRYDGGRALGLDPTNQDDTTRQENQKRGPRGAARCLTRGWEAANSRRAAVDSRLLYLHNVVQWGTNAALLLLRRAQRTTGSCSEG
jgi:hypothetical protein